MHSLNESRFCISKAIEARSLPDGGRLVKQTSRAEYLALNPEQQRILDRFDGKRNVQEVLHSFLTEGVRPRIRSFYDLVLQASHKGFLVEGSEDLSRDAVRGVRWPIGWGLIPSIIISLIMLGFGARAILTSTIVLPSSPASCLLALAALIVAWSEGHFLAGCVLSGFGRQVYGAGICWNRIIPHFSVDARDAFMGGRACEASVALQKIAGAFLVAGLASFESSGAALFGSCVAIFILTSPFGNTPAHDLLYALFRREYQLPKYASKFLSTKAITQLFDWKEKLSEEKYLLLFSTYAICWMGVVFRAAGRLNADNSHDLIRNLSTATEAGSRVGAFLGFSLLILTMAAPLVFLLWLILKSIHRLAAPMLFNAESALIQGSGSGGRPPDDQVVGHLQKILLFSQLSPQELSQAAAAMKFTTVPPQTTIIRERDMGDALFVILSGSVEVLKEDESGQPILVTKLGAGDVFGEIALLDQVPRTSTVRGIEETSLLALSKADFERLMVSALGAEKIKTIVQVCAFLKRNALFADWHPQALMSVAREFTFQEFHAGDIVIQEGRTNDAFYVIYEGDFEVRKDGSSVAALAHGDFCGEISLLHDTPATATVAATRTGRCLRLGKEKFLKFVSQDFLTGLAIETALESRLGRAAA